MQDSLSTTISTPSSGPIRPALLLTPRSYWLIGALVAMLWSLWQAGLFDGDFSAQIYNARGYTQFQQFFRASLHPQLDVAFLVLALDSLLITLAFAICGAVGSLGIGFVLGIASAEIWWQSLFPRHPQWAYTGWLCMRLLIAIPRAVHEVVWGLLFVNLIGLDPLTAIGAIAIPFGAIIAKVYGEILDEMPRQAYWAIVHSGVSPFKAMLYTLLPQSMRDLLAYGFYRFECAIRAAAVLGIIGAGGLGYQIFLSLQSLKYEQLWTFLYALVLLNGIFDFWSGRLRRQLGARVPGAAPGSAYRQRGTVVSPRPYAASNHLIRSTLFGFALLVPLAFWYVAPDVSKLSSPRLIEQLQYVRATALPPDFSTLSVSAWRDHTETTLAISILATGLAAAVGFATNFLAADNFLLPGGIFDRNHRGGRGYTLLSVSLLAATRLGFLVARSVPPPIWALILLFVFFPGVWVGALALGLYTLGVMGRLLAEVTENLDERPLYGLQTAGAGRIQVFAYGVLPATLPRFIAYALYRWEENVRATVVIGLVGAGGLGRLLVEELSRFDNQSVSAILLVFVALTVTVDLVSQRARATFR